MSLHDDFPNLNNLGPSTLGCQFQLLRSHGHQYASPATELVKVSRRGAAVLCLSPPSADRLPGHSAESSKLSQSPGTGDEFGGSGERCCKRRSKENEKKREPRDKDKHRYRGRKQIETERGKRGHWSYRKGQKLRPEKLGTAKREKRQVPRARYSIEGEYKWKAGRETSV